MKTTTTTTATTTTTRRRRRPKVSDGVSGGVVWGRSQVAEAAEMVT
jgi:hypothetical protein